jgi:hypothetical protein
MIPSQRSVLGIALHLKVYMAELIVRFRVLGPKETKQREC